jgi:predicted pyridoxine 5'-phosphate oxidase superfamily flavin-nucleotide-binding protein
MTAIAAHKTMPRLDRHSRAFISLSPFLVLATADGDGGVATQALAVMRQLRHHA